MLNVTDLDMEKFRSIILREWYRLVDNDHDKDKYNSNHTYLVRMADGILYFSIEQI